MKTAQRCKSSAELPFLELSKQDETKKQKTKNTKNKQKRDTQTLEGPCPGVIGPLVEGPCPGVIRPLEEGPCPGGTAVDVLLSSLPVSVAALPAGLTLARRFGPLGHWVHWFRLRQRSSRISTEPENLPVTDSGFIATQT